MELLLLSNSTHAGGPYMDFALSQIKHVIDPHQKVLFIPYAGISIGFDAYFELVRKNLGSLNIECSSIHLCKDKISALEQADVIMTGGGNTFHLLYSLQNEKLLFILRKQVKDGKLYVGWSAGSNLACPTIRTTNDMPIVQPSDFNALNLIPFQINPHYTDFVDKNHAGESRETRINEFILCNKSIFVAGLREGSAFHLKNEQLSLLGDKNCRVFKSGQSPIEISPGSDLSFLL